MSADKLGRPWATVSQVQVGTVLEADGGFTCMAPGVPMRVVASDGGRLAVPCRDGLHAIDGQLDHDGGDFYVGLYLHPEDADPGAHVARGSDN